jgi:hypothetical protein
MRAASARSTETFPTKIDAWLVLLVSAGVIAAFAGAAAAWQANPSPLTLRAQRGMREVEDLVR